MAWYQESNRHSKAAKGQKTGRKDRSRSKLNFKGRTSQANLSNKLKYAIYSIGNWVRDRGSETFSGYGSGFQDAQIGRKLSQLKALGYLDYETYDGGEEGRNYQIYWISPEFVKAYEEKSGEKWTPHTKQVPVEDGGKK